MVQMLFIFSAEEIQSILQRANEFLKSWKSIKSPVRQKWKVRIEKSQASWKDARCSIFEAAVSESAVANHLCDKCNKNAASVICYECQWKRQCSSCDKNTHETLPFHDRNAVVDGYVKAVAPNTSVDINGDLVNIERYLPLQLSSCPSCQSVNCIWKETVANHCIVVTLKGRFDLSYRCYYCTDCQKECSPWNTDCIIRAGFWPGSIANMHYAFQQDLFMFWDLLQKWMPGSSERSFVKSLEQFSAQKGRVPTINATSFNTSFKEWKFCQFELDSIRKKRWMSCPTCTKSQHSVHVDGNMKLYRFKSAGKSVL